MVSSPGSRALFKKWTKFQAFELAKLSRMFSWWQMSQMSRTFRSSQMSHPSRTRCLFPGFVNTVQSPVIFAPNFQKCPVFRSNSLLGGVSFVLLLKKIFYRRAYRDKVNTRNTLRSTTSGKGMGCGAGETREIVGIGGMGDTGGTKREGGGSDRRTGTNGGVIYYLNQATGGSIALAITLSC